jgi:hypothetical protein
LNIAHSTYYSYLCLSDKIKALRQAIKSLSPSFSTYFHENILREENKLVLIFSMLFKQLPIDIHLGKNTKGAGEY